MAPANCAAPRRQRRKRTFSSIDGTSSSEGECAHRASDKSDLARLSEKETTAQLKTSGKPFLQRAPCFRVAPELPQCRECRMTRHRRKENKRPNICRFYEFRKLKYDEDGAVSSCGFSVPTDAAEEELKLFFPSLDRLPRDLDVTAAVFILSQVGDHFCDIVKKEREGQSLHLGDKAVAWKHVLQGVREMCDVCKTSLFNIHWVCRECGFAVCIDCYKAKRDGTEAAKYTLSKARDEFQWLPCTDRQPHQQDKLMMTQIIADTALWDVCQELHRIRLELGIPSHCGCDPLTDDGNCRKAPAKGRRKPVGPSAVYRFLSPMKECSADKEEPPRARKRKKQHVGGTTSSGKVVVGGRNCSESRGVLAHPIKERQLLYCTLKNSGAQSTHFGTFVDCRVLYPNQNSWLCNGKLLVLHETSTEDNVALFQEQWRRGQPVLVTNVCKKLDMPLWHPDGFCRDFGDVSTDLVNCRTGAILPNQPMRRFWEGFENFHKRMKDEDGEYMLLKLKDWPPGDDFRDVLPRRFNDLMKGLPLPEYTLRDGVFNLVARLSDSFVRPDLGPKMYTAYGSALYPSTGTTNLHLDVSDAVNVMVYVGIPKDGKDEEHVIEALKAIDEGSCDTLTRKRIREKGAKPGALWHIFNARDADKIRDLLNKVAVERGEKLDLHDDPIHDQRWYLDEVLRDRLYREYRVEGYAIVQCLGDAVFIPAGAPHQVRNLHSCIKVAEDFVSPENIAHCLSLTSEFRQLSDTHTNHEDKLQIKNVVYHAAKDALAVLWANPVPNNDDEK